jgi:hypothetical protein
MELSGLARSAVGGRNAPSRAPPASACRYIFRVRIVTARLPSPTGRRDAQALAHEIIRAFSGVRQTHRRQECSGATSVMREPDLHTLTL